MTQWHGGKGSRYRKTNQETYNDNWDRVFGPIIVEWKGKMGYGDFVSACAYANNLSEKEGKKVILNWVVSKGPGERQYPDYEHPDSEDTIYRLEQIFDMMKTENVALKVRYNENLPYQHKPELPKNLYYKYRLAKKEYQWQGGGGYVVFNTTENNQKHFTDYKTRSKLWKDPVIKGHWPNVYKQWDNVKFVDYTTPVAEVVSILKNCEVLIGYAGCASSVALMMGVPNYVICNSEQIAADCLPHALVSDRLGFTPTQISDIQKQALEKISYCNQRLEEYINSTSDNEDVRDGTEKETKRETGT